MNDNQLVNSWKCIIPTSKCLIKEQSVKMMPWYVFVWCHNNQIDWLWEWKQQWQSDGSWAFFTILLCPRPGESIYKINDIWELWILILISLEVTYQWFSLVTVSLIEIIGNSTHLWLSISLFRQPIYHSIFTCNNVEVNTLTNPYRAVSQQYCLAN